MSHITKEWLEDNWELLETLKAGGMVEYQDREGGWHKSSYVTADSIRYRVKKRRWAIRKSEDPVLYYINVEDDGKVWIFKSLEAALDSAELRKPTTEFDIVGMPLSEVCEYE